MKDRRYGWGPITKQSAGVSENFDNCVAFVWVNFDGFDGPQLVPVQCNKRKGYGPSRLFCSHHSGNPETWLACDYNEYRKEGTVTP